MRTTVPPPGPRPRDLPQRRAQRGVIDGPLRFVAFGRSRLTDDSAGPALADTHAVAKHRDRAAPTVRAHQFPFETSLSARFSSA